jgi:DNA-binding response OmpR family regulator
MHLLVVEDDRALVDLLRRGLPQERHVVDATIGRLRKAVDEGFDTRSIHTVRGVGYKIKAP